MIDKPTSQIEKGDIDLLIPSRRLEDRTIEYKRDLPGTSDEERKEFLRDISSFANAQGGDILYGMEESDGYPINATGVEVSNFDELRLRLQNMIHSNLDPRLPAVEIVPISGFERGVVVLIRVLSSWRAPHMVTFNRISKFYLRGNGQKHEMDVHELRASFVGSESITERIKTFRDGRFVQILTGQSPLGTLLLPTLVVHVLPVGNAFSARDVDARRIGANWMVLNRSDGYPLVHAPADRPNLDGLLVYSPASIERINASPEYIQVFRNGGVEFTSTFYRIGADRRPAPPLGIDLFDAESQILNATRNALAFRESIGNSGACVVSVAFLHVNRVGVDAGGRPMHPSNAAFDRDVVVLPDMLIEAPALSDVPRALQVIFDSLWQAVGFQRSRSYGDDGSYVRTLR